MRTLTLKKVSDELYEELKSTASANRRSLNMEAIFRLESARKSRDLDREGFLERARKIRESIKTTFSDEEIEEAIRWGRP